MSDKLADMTPSDRWVWLDDGCKHTDEMFGACGDCNLKRLAALRDADREAGWDNGYAAGCFKTAASTVPCPTCENGRVLNPLCSTCDSTGRITREKATALKIAAWVEKEIKSLRSQSGDAPNQWAAAYEWFMVTLRTRNWEADEIDPDVTT